MHKNALQIAGKKFGMLTAVCPTDKRSGTGRSIVWIFKCDCGNEKEIPASRVASGTTVSCGCFQKAWARKSTLSRRGVKGLMIDSRFDDEEGLEDI